MGFSYSQQQSDVGSVPRPVLAQSRRIRRSPRASHGPTVSLGCSLGGDRAGPFQRT